MIQIQAIGHQGELTITIEDDGAGFDASILERGHGNGWKNIQSRLKLVKGSIEIDSRSGFGGTTVIIRMPLTALNPAEREELPMASDALRPATVARNTH